MTGVAAAQTFDSGSTGADGAFAPTGAPVEFNPKALNLDPEGDNVFHFTTITIPSGTTVKLSAKWTNGPVYWLASGAVSIVGTVDMDGQQGSPRTQSQYARVLSIPGPGGFPAGMGTAYGAAQHPGFGPRGGRTAGNPDHDYGFGTVSQWLVPLIGGSGGAGFAERAYGYWAAGGGAGGGAILIASSMNISLTGSINARGGNGGTGNLNYPHENAGSGGAIGLVAPVLYGGGILRLSGGGQSGCGYGPGRARLEAFTHNEYYQYDCGNRTVGTPFRTFVPTTPPPSIRVVGIGNMSVPPDPTGSFELPDVVFDFGNAIDVLIEARYVPPGTDVKLHLYSTDGADQIVTAPPLQGTLEQSTTAVSVVFPPGFSRGFAHAVWE